MKHNVHSRGDFLNKPFHHSDGTIFSSLVVEKENGNKNSYINWEAQFRMSDCNRTIDLNFYLNDEEDHENNLYKVDVMINHLKEFKRALERGGKLYFEMKETNKNNDKQDSKI